MTVLVDSGPVSVETTDSSENIANEIISTTQPNPFYIEFFDGSTTGVLYRDSQERDLRCYGRVNQGAWVELKSAANNFQGVNYSVEASVPPGTSRDLFIGLNPNVVSQYYLAIQIRDNFGINVIATGADCEINVGDSAGEIASMIAETFSASLIRAKEQEFGIRFFESKERVFRVYYSMNGGGWEELNATANNLQGVDLALPEGSEGTLTIISYPQAASYHTMRFQVRDNDGTTVMQTSEEVEIFGGDLASSIASSISVAWGAGPIACLQIGETLTFVDSARRVFRLFSRVDSGAWFEANAYYVNIQGTVFSYQDPPGGTLIVNLPQGPVTTTHTIEMATIESDGINEIWSSSIFAITPTSTEYSIAQNLEANWDDADYIIDNPNKATVFRNVITFDGPYFRLFVRADQGAWQEVSGSPIIINGVEYYNSEWRMVGPLQIQLAPTVASSHFLSIEARQMDGLTPLGQGATVPVNPGDSSASIGQAVASGWDVEGILCVWNGASVDLIHPDGVPFRCFGTINSGAWREIVLTPENMQGVNYAFIEPMRE